jgi:alpha-2-macroglobulin
VELVVDSKNDYEYILLEDMKPAGFEPVEVRSGYNGNEMNAYAEFRDERVALFAATVARGQHSVSYRMRAEIPGRFSALPTKVSAMYAPELKANSDEFKVRVVD